MFCDKLGFRGPFMMEKVPHTISKYIFCWKYGFTISYGISQKYPQI